MKFWFFLFSSLRLLATVNEPLRCELFSGYRNDRIHWHLQDPAEADILKYTELYRDVEYWENGLTFKVIHRDLTFFLRGAYGTFGRGTVFQQYFNLPTTDEQPRFQFSTDGWTADVAGYFGYAVNLTADRVYKVILTPLIGYSAYFEQLKRKNGRADLPVVNRFTSSLPGTFRLVWNGFLLGAGFTIEPVGKVVLNAGYSYHFMHNKVDTFLQNSLQGEQSIETSSGGNKGHTGWAQFDWALDHFWRVGIGGGIHYFFTRVVDAKLQQSHQKELFKLRWTAISASAQVSKEF